MTRPDIVLLCLLLVFTSIGAIYGTWIAVKIISIEKRITFQEKFNKARQELYESLADPEKIEREMEAGARLREMHDAKRKVLPRDDAGPPAVLHSPPLRVIRGKKAKP